MMYTWGNIDFIDPGATATLCMGPSGDATVFDSFNEQISAWFSFKIEN